MRKLLFELPIFRAEFGESQKLLQEGGDTLAGTLETEGLLQLQEGSNSLARLSLSKNSLRPLLGGQESPISHHYHQSRLLQNNYSGPGVLSFATMSARKPITHGFLNPHDERFIMPKQQFPEILTKHHHMPRVYIKGYAKRNAPKQFLTTAFTGMLHY